MNKKADDNIVICFFIHFTNKTTEKFPGKFSSLHCLIIINAYSSQ
jgi:hypothetical protein